MTDIKLSDQQSQALEYCARHDGVVKVLTGRAGSGKSTIIRALREQHEVTLAATTGMAALNVGGVTVDRLFSYDRTKNMVRDRSAQYDALSRASDVLVIDECSMIGENMGNFIHDAAKEFGKTLVLVGDFAQAAPVKDNWLTRSRLLQEAVMLKLTECHRQNERELLDALDALRLADTQSAALNALSPCMVAAPPVEDGWTHLYATNAGAAEYNRRKLNSLDADATPTLVTSATKFKGSWFNGEKEKMIEDSRLLHGWELKMGARVIITQNKTTRRATDSSADETSSFVNGDAGTVVGWDGATDVPSWIRVALDRGPIVSVGRVQKDVLNGSHDVIAMVTGFPLTLGYAITIHRSQGQTLDRVYFDMGSVMRFPRGERHGLVYVGMSRARSIAGLRLSNWSPAAVECSPAVRHLI